MDNKPIKNHRKTVNSNYPPRSSSSKQRAGKPHNQRISRLFTWAWRLLSLMPYFYGKPSVYVIIYRGKDKNTTQVNLVELVGSPVAPFWCK